jgi:predicted RNase H-like HicB family nuclease
MLMKSKRKFTVVIERDEEGYYVASVPALRGCHTQAKTLDTLMKRVREVIELCLSDGEEVDDSLELVGIQQISL